MDQVEAVKWFRKAAEQGNAAAQLYVGLYYHAGDGVEKDYAAAATWYRKAAKQGNAQAQFALGLCYYQAEGVEKVEKDYAEAANWFREAAEQGYNLAQTHLGLCYYEGQGVEQNSVESYAWFNLASKMEQSAAKNRDELEETGGNDVPGASPPRAKAHEGIAHANRGKA